MKNIRHINIRNTAIAIVALTGLAVATTACFGNSSTDSASKALDATIEAVADQPESAAKDDSPAATSSDTADVESPTPSTATPATAAPTSPEAIPVATEGFENETAPSTETPSAEAPSTAAPTSPEAIPAATEGFENETAPGTEAPATTTPATTTPTTPSTPGIVLLPTIHFVTFAKDGLNISTSILVEEGGLGRNDIVSVEMSYTKFGVTRTVAATIASSTTTSSLWLIDGLMLRAGDTVTIHAVDARGNSDDMTATVTLTTSMG
ncbi:MAG: hypothetical protein F2909_10000 [Actinobacteria bacterium]|uniref:Unannotated protein n=1 Tax=freshwater metagenome TaxID=449393 RepID=A0A6J7EN05_9ZZZZ|nr:hypothetical protein [Actinomycetota bacterium]MSX15429.1 hypothetical protein [Actinomycetota bacterium]MSX37560.1 hypothetical protein [Actinomycetota bacterium]MSX76826.1 hypothetical protein [Actinomycetota bacterium]MUH56000.1 hypothetical protein [Actinomycetota bacterium]